MPRIIHGPIIKSKLTTSFNYFRYLYLYELEHESQIHGSSEVQSSEDGKYQNSSEGEYTAGIVNILMLSLFIHAFLKFTFHMTCLSQPQFTNNLDSPCSSFLFNIKTHIKIQSKLHDSQTYYAKILKRRIRDGVPSYYVMYNGWTVRY